MPHTPKHPICRISSLFFQTHCGKNILIWAIYHPYDRYLLDLPPPQFGRQLKQHLSSPPKASLLDHISLILNCATLHLGAINCPCQCCHSNLLFRHSLLGRWWGWWIWGNILRKNFSLVLDPLSTMIFLSASDLMIQCILILNKCWKKNNLPCDSSETYTTSKLNIKNWSFSKNRAIFTLSARGQH